MRWAAEHSAKTAPIGTILYDDDDDLFTVKTGPDEWTAYYCAIGMLDNRDIDRDRGDQMVGRLETIRGIPVEKVE